MLAGGLTLVGGQRLHAAPLARAEAKPRLYVFVHVDLKSNALERTLQQKLPELAVTVFGRFRDLEERMVAERPDAVMALGPLLTLQGVEPAVQGTREGKDKEPYVLLQSSAGNVIGAGKTIGVVEVLGRSGTRDLVVSLLKNNEVKLKYVTKLEDLLPLLQFAAADAVLVPRAAVRTFQERSRLPLVAKELPGAEVGLPAVGVLNPRVRTTVLSAMKALDGEGTRILGVEKWVTR